MVGETISYLATETFLWKVVIYNSIISRFTISVHHITVMYPLDQHASKGLRGESTIPI
jgi:hypothetical protein